MEVKVLASSQQSLLLQRNVLGAVSAICLVSNLVLGICLLRQEKTVILVPPHISNAITITDKHLSSGYLEEITDFFLGKLLDLSPGNFEHKSKIILRHVHPAFHSHMHEFFEQEKKRYEEFKLSTHFVPSEMKIDENNLVVRVRGTLISSYGASGKSEEKCGYRIEYDYKNGILTIKDFSLLKSQSDEDKKDNRDRTDKEVEKQSGKKNNS